ncbi:hypothetical protein FC093_22920 [Ilyomonas limi]|uniref:Uncharacterized protein n=1 Tax=Ilyomonas limi TaxID=2575867 RepID=A0A4U3KPU6_9BACT|nr:hypothetical protein [Ilyomonas limi]TKK64285.1 hypothetical protein FC093_22920 [Ilyomonas limi]
MCLDAGMLYAGIEKAVKNQVLYAGKDVVKNLPLIITHEKPEDNNEQRIKVQLQQMKDLQLRLIFPTQSEPFNL